MRPTLTTRSLDFEKETILVEGEVFDEYFQEDYFQSGYFQTGGLFISGNTPTSTLSLDPIRVTKKLSDL